ncbi:hypothetical protein [Mucilaginibacter lacusdianchii]|uniref:hypothetical protein n=1 Tax=Mucilaginibacter lacusdianchii TaxID=2684211 RepID=UPI00131A943A|nr:hypothetical protein [Mucilaginibacter sp. JXJ CY 39]
MQQIALPDLFLLIAYLSFPVWCIARAVQWVQLKAVFGTSKRIMVLAASLLVSFILTIVIWGRWPGNPMISIISIPALCAEVIVWLMTFVIKKSLLKKWHASS